MAAIITYAIVDDHEIFRTGLKSALSDDPALELLYEAGDGEEILQKIKKQAPDILLLDLKLPKINGVDVIQKIRSGGKKIKIILLTGYHEEYFITSLFKAGANAFLLKNTNPSEIKTAIRAVYESGHYVNEMVSNAMVKSLSTKCQNDNDILLNDREKEVLFQICMGLTSAEIGQKLFLSARTII